MRICRLIIKRFRGVREATLLLPGHVVLVGDNNVGKSTVLEAIDLVLGPDRLRRLSKIDEHDFYHGEYLPDDDGEPRQIEVEVTVTDLNDEQQNRFKDYIEWWNNTQSALHTEPPPESVDAPDVSAALRVTFIGKYDPGEDDFAADTVYTRSLEESNTPVHFRKVDKQYCGFLYLRSLRTGYRALSLEHGSLLDIILRLKELRPQMWEATITELEKLTVASDPELGISGILESIEAALKRYVPREWGVTPHLKVSNLTREHLRQVITAFIATGDGDHAAPFYRQGTGTINMLVLAMLSQIADDKQNVIFAMEEPETAIPPYAQKRIVHELRSLAAQSILTSHSPYVLEEFNINEIAVLSRSDTGEMAKATITLPDSIKHKRYRQEFRTRFCEGLLSRRILLAEGATEAAAMPAVARRLAEVGTESYASFEALGLCTIDAGTDSQIVDLANLYGSLGKDVFAVCDKQTPEREKEMKSVLSVLYMHPEYGFEKLVLKNTKADAMERFIGFIDWPPHLQTKYHDPKAKPAEALSEYFSWSKGTGGIADFLVQCTEDEIPYWIRTTCKDLRKHLHIGDDAGNAKTASQDGSSDD